MGVADINRQISEMKLFLPPQALDGQLAKPYNLLLPFYMVFTLCRLIDAHDECFITFSPLQRELSQPLFIHRAADGAPANK